MNFLQQMDSELNSNKNMEYDIEKNIFLNRVSLSDFDSSLGETETIQLNEDIVNLGVKLGPPDFELKKVLGKGGYGKVFQVITITSAPALFLHSSNF